MYSVPENVNTVVFHKANNESEMTWLLYEIETKADKCWFNSELRELQCGTGCNGWRSVPNDAVLVDETLRNINTDPTAVWKGTGKEQDPTLAYFSIEGVVWVGVVGH